MKDIKKIKLGKLNFYIIDDNYIKYLSQFDKHIAYNKNEKRPYIGVVIIVREHYYFAPLFSPKQKQFALLDEKNDVLEHSYRNENSSTRYLIPFVALNSII